MKTKLLLLLLGAAVSMQFISCKKAVAPATSVNASNAELAVGRTNLVAWYKFKNGSTGDYSGKNNHLTAYNVTLATDYMGRPDGAYYFDGSSSYMEAPNSTSLNPTNITMAALVKPTGFYTGTVGDSRIVMKGVDDQSSGDYYLGFHNTGEAYGTYGDNQFQSNSASSSTGAIQLNNWYKIVYTYDGAVGKLYINGILVSKVKKTASFNANTSPLRIGVTGRSDFPFWFNGVIDEIRIYDTALTNSQVSKLTNELGQ